MRTKGQSGFSLVELMVVVAIIGVLATIAIPRVNRFIAKSRQTEAQVNLSSLYTFNKNFFVEFQGYTTAFDAMGFKPEGNLRYNVGFSAGLFGPQNYLDLKTLAAYTGPVDSKADCAAHASRCVTLQGANGAEPADLTAATTANNNQEFTAKARAFLIKDVEDFWSITNNKKLVNDADGTVEAD